MSNDTVAITGISGFLGSYLGAECIAQGYRVVGIDRTAPAPNHFKGKFILDDCSTANFDTIFERSPPRLVVHLAASASVPLSVSHPAEDFHSVVPGTVRLLDAVRKLADKPKVLLISSAAVYGNPRSLPISESDPTLPVSPYGVHKLAAESLLRDYGRLYEFDSAALRVFSAYGPRLRRQIVWDFCSKVVSPEFRDTSIELFGTGHETRDFIHAKDVARAILCVACTHMPGHTTYNVASGEETTIAHVCSSLSAFLGRSRPHFFNNKVREGDPLHWKANISELSSIGFSPSIRLEDGLAETAHWVASQFS